jgi:hypothetical protein
MKKALHVAVLSAMLVPGIAVAGKTAKVTNGENDGPGSFRVALASGASKIVIAGSVDTITVTEPLQYIGTDPLRVVGSGQVVQSDFADDSTAPIFEVTNGADLTMSKLSFVGPGGYSRDAVIEADNEGKDLGGKGIFLNVPVTRTGTVHANFTNVSVSDVGNHGIHISDCTIGDACGGGSGGGGEGSPASVKVVLKGVSVHNVGFGKQDADGVRVDERGDGDIIFDATNSMFKDVGADGVEVDEGNTGDVLVKIRRVVFFRNGEYCAQAPEDFPADVYNDNVHFPDGDPCDDDGPDLDDGFDIDEAGDGSIKGKITGVDVVANFDEGLDFDEEDAGGFDMKLTSIFADQNGDEGIKLSEEGPDGVVVDMRAINATGDVEVEEENEGDYRVTIKGSSIGDDLKLSKEEDPAGTVKLRGTSVGDEKDFDNVEEI